MRWVPLGATKASDPLILRIGYRRLSGFDAVEPCLGLQGIGSAHFADSARQDEWIGWRPCLEMLGLGPAAI